jgi:hypothetical protein
VGLAEWADRDKSLQSSSRSKAWMRWLTAAAVSHCCLAAPAIEPVSTTAIRLSKYRMSIFFLSFLNSIYTTLLSKIEN